MTGDVAFYFSMAIGSLACAALLFPMARALGERIANKGIGGERLAELERRMAYLEGTALTSGEVEAQFSRFDQLEDRLDFAERMITEKVEPSFLKDVEVSHG